MNIRFYNCLILTMEENKDIIDGELWVKDDTIAYVGQDYTSENNLKESYENTRWDREIDCKGNVIMPGFKNAHTHSAMTFLRSFADDMALQDWLYKQVFPREAMLTDEDVYWLSRLAFLEYLTSGITASFDMYGHYDYHVKAATDTGFRTVLCGDINDFGGTAQSLEEEYLKYNQADKLVSCQLGFHAEYTTSKKLMKEIAKLAQKLKAPVYTHNSETSSEVSGCFDRYGVSPTVLMDHLDMFEYGGGGFHCVHVSDADLDIFKEHNMWVITNPASNLKLASGIAPLDKMHRAGVNLAIGTDGPASNNCLDMWKEMSLAACLQKVKTKNSAAMPADKVLWMATVGGAGAMCLHNCDTLAVGKQADLIMVDMNRPNMQPVHNIVKNLVYSGSKDNVLLTMIAGKVLYENREFHVNEDVSTIYQQCQKITDRICYGKA